MKTSTQVYRELKAAQFTDPQAKALVEILQAGGIVERAEEIRRDALPSVPDMGPM